MRLGSQAVDLVDENRDPVDRGFPEHPIAYAHPSAVALRGLLLPHLGFALGPTSLIW